jgi:hypothetical protein
MKVRIFLLGIILGAALLVLPAGADSAVSTSTFGLYDDETDIFLDPNDYGDVEFDNVFLFLKGDGTDNAGMEGGFATRIKGLYLGFGFDTNLWDGSQTLTKVDGDQKDFPPFSFGPVNPVTKKPTLTVPNRGIIFNGEFNLLLGTGNIGGFKLTFDFDDVSLYTANDDKPGVGDEVSYSDGKLLIDLGWGKNFDFKGGVLAPEVHLGYQISTFKLEVKGDNDAFSYVTYYDFDDNTWQTEYFEKMSHLLIGAGAEYTSPTGAHLFSLDYGLDIGIHPVTIEDDGSDATKWKGYSVGNSLTGGYSRTVGITERFSLAFGANLGLELLSQREDFTDKPDPYDTVTFSISPDVSIGASYTFGKFPFTLYGALRHGSLERDDLDDEEYKPFYSVVYTNDNADKPRENWKHEFAPWGLSAGLGLTFAPIKNFTLDFGLSQELGYYSSVDREYQYGFDEEDSFSFTLQAIIKL